MWKASLARGLCDGLAPFQLGLLAGISASALILPLARHGLSFRGSRWNTRLAVADRIIPETAASADWSRIVAGVVNRHSRALNGLPYPMIDAAPDNPVEGQTYYDTALHKVRTWDGGAWQNHW